MFSKRQGHFEAFVAYKPFFGCEKNRVSKSLTWFWPSVIINVVQVFDLLITIKYGFFLVKFWNHACSRFVEIKFKNENKRASDLSLEKFNKLVVFMKQFPKNLEPVYTCKWFLGFIWLMLELVVACFDKSLYCHECWRPIYLRCLTN